MPLPFPSRFPHGWKHPDAFLAIHGGDLGQTMREALCCNDSLTRHLETLAGHSARVRLERQELVPTWEVEAALWNGNHVPPPPGEVLLRNAWLELAGRDWIFAHSQVAMSDLTTSARQVIDQGVEPLGSLFLEQDGLVSRQGLELALAHSPALAARLQQPADQLFWCRRSRLQVNGHFRARILEIFLSSLTD